MRRRPSSSAEEEDDAASIPDPSFTGHGDKTTHDTLNEVGMMAKEERSTTARRKRDGMTSVPTSTKPQSQAWRTSQPPSGTLSEKELNATALLPKDIGIDGTIESIHKRRARWRNPWSLSLLTLFTTSLAALFLLTIVHSFLTRQLDPKGCAMSYMRPSFVRYSDFDTEHTRFASKYSLYLYREGIIDENPKVRRKLPGS